MRPEDIYCKPVFGTRTETTSLLLRVKRRRRKVTTSGQASGSGATEAKQDVEEEWKAEILGTVGCTFRFQCKSILRDGIRYSVKFIFYDKDTY